MTRKSVCRTFLDVRLAGSSTGGCPKSNLSPVGRWEWDA